MLSAGEDELFCDLAETYGLLSPRTLPVSQLAMLAAGLGPDARIRQRMQGVRAGCDTLLLASILDRLGQLTWLVCGGRGKRPPQLLPLLLGPGGENETQAFDSAAAFEAARQRILAPEQAPRQVPHQAPEQALEQTQKEDGDGN